MALYEGKRWKLYFYHKLILYSSQPRNPPRRHGRNDLDWFWKQWWKVRIYEILQHFPSFLTRDFFFSFFGINISRDVFGANVIFWKVKFYFFWSRLSCGLTIKEYSWKIKVLSMQYCFEKLYDYFYKLLQFPREALRKKPSQFWEKQKNSSAVKAFLLCKTMSFFINETNNKTIVPSKCVEK